MELRVEPVTIPEKFLFNYEELKQELEEKVSVYSTMVYTDDQIKGAKADRADLNRLKKALNDERIRREKEYMQPFNDFKAQINEIIGIIDKPVALIDKQIKSYEEQQRQEKKQKIFDYWRGEYVKPDINFDKTFDKESHMLFEKIFDNKWLNTSVSLKSVQTEIDSKIEAIKADLTTLSNLPEFAFEAIETYKSTLDLNKSIAEGHRLSEMQKRKAEQERIKAEQEKVKAEQERLRREQEEQTRAAMPQAKTEPFVGTAEITPKEVAESAEAYREAANVGGVHMSEELSKQWVSFKAFLSVDNARELKEFFESRNIKFERI